MPRLEHPTQTKTDKEKRTKCISYLQYKRKYHVAERTCFKLILSLLSWYWHNFQYYGTKQYRKLFVVRWSTTCSHTSPVPTKIKSVENCVEIVVRIKYSELTHMTVTMHSVTNTLWLTLSISRFFSISTFCSVHASCTHQATSALQNTSSHRTLLVNTGLIPHWVHTNLHCRVHTSLD